MAELRSQTTALETAAGASTPASDAGRWSRRPRLDRQAGRLGRRQSVRSAATLRHAGIRSGPADILRGNPSLPDVPYRKVESRSTHAGRPG